MPMIYVTPAKGARVRMPERGSTVMPEKGDWVPDTVHYAGLIRTGDVVRADPQPPFPGAGPAAGDTVSVSLPSDVAPAVEFVPSPTSRTAPKEK